MAAPWLSTPINPPVAANAAGKREVNAPPVWQYGVWQLLGTYYQFGEDLPNSKD